jgi:hypothetical protein
MPGMQSGIGVSNALIAEAFRSALWRQLVIAAVIFLALWLARLIAVRSWPIKRTAGIGRPAGKARAGGAARTVIQPSRPDDACSGSASASSGSSTGSCRRSLRCPSACPGRSSSPPRRVRPPGSGTWSTGAAPRGPITRSRLRRRWSGSREAAAPSFPAGWVSLHQWLDNGSRDTSWSQYTNVPVPAAGTRVTVGDAAPAAGRWDLAAVELTGGD